MVQNLTGIDNDAVMDLRIPNAAPFVFEFDKNLDPIRNYYLGENEDIPVTESTKAESYETRFMASYWIISKISFKTSNLIYYGMK